MEMHGVLTQLVIFIVTLDQTTGNRFQVVSLILVLVLMELFGVLTLVNNIYRLNSD